jgi:hypothetical protein
LLPLALNNLVRSPLRHIPGPLYTRLSNLWLYTVTFFGWRTSSVHGLHIRYGPVVRIAPNHLSFATSVAFRDILAIADDDADIHAEANTILEAKSKQIFQRSI